MSMYLEQLQVVMDEFNELAPITEKVAIRAVTKMFTVLSICYQPKHDSFNHIQPGSSIPTVDDWSSNTMSRRTP